MPLKFSSLILKEKSQFRVITIGRLWATIPFLLFVFLVGRLFLFLRNSIFVFETFLVFGALQGSLTTQVVFQRLFRLVRKIPVLDVLLVRLDEGLALGLQVGDLGRRFVPKFFRHAQVHLDALGNKPFKGPALKRRGCCLIRKKFFSF